MTHIAVVVPVYNSAAVLDELINRLKAVLSDISQSYKIILVDDRGTEPVWPIIKNAASGDERVSGIRLSKNFGQHSAITAGMDFTDADWVIVMDGDLQDRPEDIKLLYETAVQSNAYIVIAERETSGLSWRRNLGSQMFNSILKRISGLELSHKYGNFRIISRTVCEAYRQYREQMRLFPAIIDLMGFEPVYLTLPRSTRPVGKSSYTFSRLFKLAFQAVIAYSTRPLIFLAGLGILVTLIATLFAAFVLVRAALYGSPITGWPSLMVTVTFFGGLQLFTTSFVGIYVGEVFKESKSRPIYLAEELVNLKSAQVPA